MPFGGSNGARATCVKPNSRGSEGIPREEHRVIEGRREASCSKAPLRRSWRSRRPCSWQGVHPHGEALETGLAEAEEGVSKERPDRGGGDGASEVRPETGHRESNRLEGSRRVRRSRAFRRERNARPRSGRGFGPSRKSEVARDA